METLFLEQYRCIDIFLRPECKHLKSQYFEKKFVRILLVSLCNRQPLFFPICYLPWSAWLAPCPRKGGMACAASPTKTAQDPLEISLLQPFKVNGL